MAVVVSIGFHYAIRDKVWYAFGRNYFSNYIDIDFRLTLLVILRVLGELGDATGLPIGMRGCTETGDDVGLNNCPSGMAGEDGRLGSVSPSRKDVTGTTT